MALSLKIASSIQGVTGRYALRIGSNLLANSRLVPFRTIPLKNSLTHMQQPIRTIALSTPKLMSSHMDHGVIWKAERFLSIGLLGLLPVCLMFPSKGLDSLLAVTIVMHQHWGIEAIAIDYIRPIVFGNVIPKIAHRAAYVLSFLMLGGLLYFNYNDIGISQSIRKLWAIKA